MSESSLTTVKRYAFAHEAELDRCMLESRGIEAFVADANAPNTNVLLPAGMGSVRLQVRTQDAAAAAQFLRDSGESKADVPACNSCGSPRLKTKLSAVILSLLFVLPVRKRRRCLDCGADQ